MTHSHGPPTPLITGTDPEQLKECGFSRAKIAAAIKHSPFLRNMCSAAQAPEPDRFGGDLADEGISKGTAGRLERLAVHMRYPWPNIFTDPDTSDDNDAIPAGYTYLAQLAGHDIVHNVGPMPSLDEPTGHLARNFRATPLILDTLYGGGPAAGSLPFAAHGLAPEQRWALRLGHVSQEEIVGPILDRQPPRDIGRARCPHLNDAQHLPIKGPTEALIADPRNDDHLLLSQLTALLHEFHNIVSAALHAMKRGDGAPLSGFAEYRTFLEARKVVAFVYRRIIVDDLLCKLLNPAVYAFYRGAQYPRDFLETSAAGVVPVEFSHAAYRFGHVMVRFSYELNATFARGTPEGMAPIRTILDRSSARYPRLMPVAAKWLVDWARFFEDPNDPGTKPNPSRRLRPYVGSGGPMAGETYFPNDHGAEGGIYYRDFVRGADAGVRSVSSLIDQLKAANRPLPQLLADSSYREHVIGLWLKHQDESLLDSDLRHKFQTGELAALSHDPPLMFFILFEAALEEHGKRLGTLGSTIVAEVFFAALETTRSAIEGDKFAAEQVARLFGSSVPNTMPLLIKWIQDNGGLRPVQTAP